MGTDSLQCTAELTLGEAWVSDGLEYRAVRPVDLKREGGPAVCPEAVPGPPGLPGGRQAPPGSGTDPAGTPLALSGLPWWPATGQGGRAPALSSCATCRGLHSSGRPGGGGRGGLRSVGEGMTLHRHDKVPLVALEEWSSFLQIL